MGPAADYLEHYVWGWPSQTPLLAVILLLAGLFVTVRLAFIQLRGFRHAVDITRGVYDNPEHAGDLSHFQALTTALSATVGIGNIAGVALAIRLGGPGALFWMWVTAFFGMALKYAECTLALMHRKVNEDGSVSGGPMYYIELGMGKQWKWMALAFAAFAAISSFGGGCMNQSNTLAGTVQAQWGVPKVVTALIFTTIVAAVIVGGIRRIGRVTSILAPFMAIVYVSGAMMILIVKFAEIPSGFALIVTEAFAPGPLVGGAAGSLIMTVMWGIRRGLFSNEAGQGSAPIAHATAKTDEPVREGLVASLGPFIDTLVICTMTGLVIVLTGAYKDKVDQTLDLGDLTAVVAQAGANELSVAGGTLAGGTLNYYKAEVENARLVDDSGAPWSGRLSVDGEGALSVASGDAPSVEGEALLVGAPLTAYSFRKALGGFGQLIVTFAVILFAVSTGISWSYYGDRSVEYLFGPVAIPIYRWMFIAFFFLGSILPLKAVWTFGDVALGLMSLPNLIALILLTGGVAMASKDYFSREHKPFR
ncbi:MAG: alanine:cation symporter family protein [bacterium]|nr:alanine:cation symporter family protein [bacterium]